MYLTAQGAMARREHIASPVCAVDTMQQPGLGCGYSRALASYNGMGDLSSGTFMIGNTSVSIPLLAGGVLLLAVAGMLFARKGKRSGGSSKRKRPVMRRTTTTFATAQ
jgi:hypothetical protein